jgi:molecular chaperone DnaJ
MESSGRAPPGDLFVHIQLEPDPRIRREGTRAFTDVTVPLRLALLGGEVEVRALGSTIRLKVPPGTQPEREFRLKGEGFPRFGGGGRGDLFVTVHVEIPHPLTGRQKQLIEEAFSEETGPRRGSIFGRRG